LAAVAYLGLTGCSSILFFLFTSALSEANSTLLVSWSKNASIMATYMEERGR